MEQQDTHYHITIIENQQPSLGHVWLSLIADLVFEINHPATIQLEKGDD